MLKFKPDFLIDIEWLYKISYRLERFKKISSTGHVYESRCIICGDSKRKKRLARCHFYETHRSLNVHCKNCGYSHSFYTFMRDAFINDFDEYKKDQLKQSIENVKTHSNKSQIKNIVELPIDDNKNCDKETSIEGIVPILSLNEDHEAVKYLKNRGMERSELEKLFYSDNFKTTALSLSYKELSDSFPSDPRIVIPFYSEDGVSIEMIQGRSLDKDILQRYVTVKSNKDSIKIFNCHNIDHNKTVYCVEGPLDSLFIDNCVATADSNLLRAKADVYIFDNEPRNTSILKLIENAINLNKNVMIWPFSPDKKQDINDLIKSGMSRKDLMNLIKNNTFNGAKAKLKFFKWRKA